jgi:hypothetical protein
MVSRGPGNGAVFPASESELLLLVEASQAMSEELGLRLMTFHLWTNLGNLYLQAGRRAPAEDALQRAAMLGERIRDDVHGTELRQSLGAGLARCYVETGAIEQAKQTLAMVPDNKKNDSAVAAARAALEIAEQANALGPLTELEQKLAGSDQTKPVPVEIEDVEDPVRHAAHEPDHRDGREIARLFVDARRVHEDVDVAALPALLGVLGDDAWSGSIAVALGGEASVATNGFWSALTMATTLSLPMLFYVEDNGLGISVRGDMQTPGGNIARNLASFGNLLLRDGDGTDPAQSALLLHDAVAHVRGGRGPALVRLTVPRLSSHSGPDNQKGYRSDDEIARDWERDPLPRLRAHLRRACSG